MTEIIAAAGGFGVALVTIVAYILVYPEKAERVGGWIACFVAQGIRRVDRTAVALSVQGAIDNGRAEIVKNVPPGILERRLKIRWAKTPDEATAVLSRGEVLVVMQPSSQKSQNVANAVMAYLPRALLPEIRRHVDRSRMRAGDLVVAKSLLGATKETEGVEFPRFRGHLIAGPSGLAARIGVHAVNPAVFA